MTITCFLRTTKATYTCLQPVFRMWPDGIAAANRTSLWKGFHSHFELSTFRIRFWFRRPGVLIKMSRGLTQFHRDTPLLQKSPRPLLSTSFRLHHLQPTYIRHTTARQLKSSVNKVINDRRSTSTAFSCY